MIFLKGMEVGRLKVVAFTDIHLGVTAFHDRIKTMLTSFADQIINEVKPDSIICLGDVFHTKKPSSEVIEFATQFFKKLADNTGNVMILPGNHDRDAFNNTTATDFLDDITTNIEVIHEPVETMDYLFMPYMRVLTPELRQKIAVHPQVFLHQGYSEAIMYGSTKYGNKTDAVSKAELKNKRLAVFGHIHNPYYNPKQGIYVLGAPYQLRYTDPLLQRGFACWDIENPSSFKIIPYKRNFYLQAITETLPVSKSTVDDLIRMLPSPAPNYYYQVNLSLEGKHQPSLEAEIRALLNDIYKGVLDSTSIIAVVPKKDRKFYTELKLASTLKELKAPTEMLSVYMDQTQGNFYKANQQLRTAILSEFSSIVSRVAEQGH